MKTIKKLITIALATTMLLGATMTVNAAPIPSAKSTWYVNCPNCGTITPHDFDGVQFYNCRYCLHQV